MQCGAAQQCVFARNCVRRSKTLTRGRLRRRRDIVQLKKPSHRQESLSSKTQLPNRRGDIAESWRRIKKIPNGVTLFGFADVRRFRPVSGCSPMAILWANPTIRAQPMVASHDGRMPPPISHSASRTPLALVLRPLFASMPYAD